MRCRPELAAFALGVAACGAPAKIEPPSAAAAVVTATAPGAPLPAPASRALRRRDPHVGPNGEQASLERGRVHVVRRAGDAQVIESSELHPPSGDRALFAILATALLFLDDGTLLVGVGDGTVAAVDGEGRRRFALGFRGAVNGLVPAGGGLAVVTTEHGTLALMTGEGRLRWERQLTGGILGPAVLGPGGMILAAGPRGVVAYSPAGELVFSHALSLDESCCGADTASGLTLDASGLVTVKGVSFRLDDPHPVIPSLEPTFPLTYRRVLDRKVTSLLARKPDELLALVEGRGGDLEVVRVEGGRATRIPAPERTSRTEVFDDERGPEKAWIWKQALAEGPGGEVWILGRRWGVPLKQWDWRIHAHAAVAGHILELRGAAFRERDDLYEAFTLNPFRHHDTIEVAPEGRGGLLCFGRGFVACAAHDGARFHEVTPPGGAASVGRIGDRTWLVTEENEIFRVDGMDLVPVPAPEGVTFSRVAGTSDRDVWAHGGKSLAAHFDGARWAAMGVPAFEGGLVARAADDVWSKDGRAHWDGHRWSVVHGAPPGGALIARGRGDVWLGGPEGLWRGTAPGPAPVRLPAPGRPDEGALAAPPALPLGAPEAGYVVEAVRIEVAGGEPLTAAKSIAASSDGALWVGAWDRVVEVDAAGKGAVVRRGERLSFGRWFHPEAQGRGIVLEQERGSWQRIEGGKATREEVRLDHHDLVAVDGDERGSTWVLGTLTWGSPYSARAMRDHELSPHALVRAGEGGSFLPVLGLPAAFYCDVAAAPDGGAWFAGALNAGPMGEGILFHARGPRGSDGTSRYRAAATLFAVAAVGPGEAWAVGAAGTVVHVVGGEVRRYRLASGAWLRAVAGSGPGDVWIGGDGGTLLHHDGRELRAVDQPLGARAAITGIAASKGAVWAVGPSGILRIRKRP